MYIEIETVATIGKSLNVKREKGDDDIEVCIAHLKFSNAFVQREVLDQLLGMPIGWSQVSLFDEQGAPFQRLEITPNKFAANITGKITGVENNHGLTLKQADLSAVVLSLYDKGAILSGEISWSIAGDETSDTESLLGRLCKLHAVVQDSGQQDMLKVA